MLRFNRIWNWRCF